MNYTVNQRNIVVDEFGEGDPILCVHGLGGSRNFWRSLVNSYQDEYRFIVPDLPSAGHSDINDSLSIPSLADDLITLLNLMSVSQCKLIGHSMGTIVCQYMASLYPERIQSMVLLGPLAEPPQPARAALKARAEQARINGMQGIADVIADVALAQSSKKGFSNTQGFVREMVINQPAEGYALSCEALSEAQAADASRIKCKCLLITGDEDKVAPPENVERLHQALPKSEYRLLNQCGHWTLTEQVEAVNNHINEFLD